MMFLYLPLLYIGDIPLVSYNAILDYSSTKKKGLSVFCLMLTSVWCRMRDLYW